MQFLPTTWDEAGIGQGDINNPQDAINGAARYLVRRGGPGDMSGAIWGYNNSDDYVSAVQAYAALLRQDPAAYAAIYNWRSTSTPKRVTSGYQLDSAPTRSLT